MLSFCGARLVISVVQVVLCGSMQNVCNSKEIENAFRCIGIFLIFDSRSLLAVENLTKARKERGMTRTLLQRSCRDVDIDKMFEFSQNQNGLNLPVHFFVGAKYTVSAS